MAYRAESIGLMLTMTTYGTWLRGDARGWVSNGRTLPAAPQLEAHDASLLKQPPFLFAESKWYEVGDAIGQALVDRLAQRLLALTVGAWHVHVVLADSPVPVPRLVKCAKDAVRYSLRVGRPIWTAGYDKRYCYGTNSLRARVAYVERHNLERQWPARPWPFLVALDS